MADSASTRRRPLESPELRKEPLATPLQMYGALSVAALLLLVATLAAVFGRSAGPEIKPFVPITATIWSLADLLTAFLLLAQFYIKRRLLFGILAGTYAFSGLMTWTFVGTFPHLFSPSEVTIASEQIPSFAWCLWHATFPILVTSAVLLDAKRASIVSRERTALSTAFFAVCPALAAGVITCLAIVYRGALPHFIIHGTFQPAYRFALLPLVAALNAAAAFILLRRRRDITPLELWLGLATFAACIDVLLVEVSTARYSVAWDVGKLLAVVTGSMVLIMMLWDVIGMYGRLARVERIDALTSLATRHSFEERLRAIFQERRRLPTSLALLIVSIDSFARYGESQGTTAADECMQRIARELLECAPRPVDFVARYGDEEFVVLLNDTPLVAVRMTAERIRSIVERLQIVRGGTAFRSVTVSIGIAFTNDTASTKEQTLFDAADRALHDAIARGRNRVMLAPLDDWPADDEPSALIAVSVGSAIR